MVYVYLFTFFVAVLGILVALFQFKDSGIAGLSATILLLSLTNYVNQYKVHECQQTLPRNESCELVAVPSSTLVESVK